MEKIISKHMLLGVLGIVVLTYLPLNYGFFQQDEWLAFGNLIAEGNSSIASTLYNYFSFDVGHWVPAHRIIFYLLYSVFGIRYRYWFFSSLLWHLVNVYLVYRIFKLSYRSKRISLTASLLFGTLSSIYQATSWVGANVNTHGASTFALLSIYFFFKDVFAGSINKTGKHVIWSILFLGISLLFKEIAIGLVAVYVISLVILDRRKKKELRSVFAYGAFGIFYVALRAFMFMTGSAKSAPVVTETQDVTEIVYNLLTFPAKAFSQTIIPQNLFISVGNWLGRIYPESFRPVYGTNQFDVFVQSVILETISISVFLTASFVFYHLLKKTKDRKRRFVAIFGSLYIVFMNMIFAFSPERFGKISILDSRNLYLSSLGILLVIVAFYRQLRVKKRTVIFVVTLYLLINIFYIEKQFDVLVRSAKERKMILNSIMKQYPQIKKKTIIYTESDTAYFGLPDNTKILPFQSGLGQTLLVSYSEKANIEREFFTDNFLWEIDSQEYREVKGNGFGYFRDFDLLAETVKAYSVPIENIIAYSWKDETKQLNDISAEVQVKLRKKLKE